MKTRITDAFAEDGQLIVSIDVIDDVGHVVATRRAGLPVAYEEKHVRLAEDNALKEYRATEQRLVEQSATLASLNAAAQAAATALLKSSLIDEVTEREIEPMVTTFREELAAIEEANKTISPVA